MLKGRGGLSVKGEKWTSSFLGVGEGVCVWAFVRFSPEKLPALRQNFSHLGTMLRMTISLSPKDQ